MNIDAVMEFFYERISFRVRQAVTKSGLRQEDIHSNQKLISKIINNKRDRHNRFLVIDSVFYCEIVDDTTGDKKTAGLLGVKELGFKDEKTVLWGTDDEINHYLFDLFEHLIQEVFSDPYDYDIDIEKYLCDYVPYAKYSTYWKVIKQNIYPAIFYGVSEDTLAENLYLSKQDAIQLLYTRCSDRFAIDFHSFIHDIKSFRGIDKIFKEMFVDEKFVPLIKSVPPSQNSLGLRVQQLILSDLSHTASLVIGETINNSEYTKALIHASSAYVLALEHIYNCYIAEKEEMEPNILSPISS